MKRRCGRRVSGGPPHRCVSGCGEVSGQSADSDDMGAMQQVVWWAAVVGLLSPSGATDGECGVSVGLEPSDRRQCPQVGPRNAALMNARVASMPNRIRVVVVETMVCADSSRVDNIIRPMT